MVLAPNSRAQVYKDRLEVATLRISPADTHTIAQVLTQDSNHVTINAVQGLVDVRNGAGVLVATVRPGMALAFSAQAGGAATATKIKGCAFKRDGKYFVTDTTTNVTVELQGPDVDKHAGHHVEITGSMLPGITPGAPASQVVEVVTWDSVGSACKVPAGAVAAGAAAGGLSTGVIVAIVGGVAAVATTVGLAAAGTFSGKSATSTP